MKFQDFDNEYKADRERVESFNGGDEYKIQHYNDELRVFTFTNNLSFSKRDGRLIIINFFKNIYDNKRKEIMDTIINYKTFFITGVSDEIDKNYIVSIEFRKSNLFDYQTRSTEHLHMNRNTLDDVKAKLESGKPYFRFPLHEDTNKNFYGYLVFIKVKENNEFTDKYLDYYFTCSDSRTYKDTVVVTDWVPTEMNKDNKNTSDLPRNLLIYGAPGTGKSHYMDEQFAKVLYKKYFPCEKNPDETTTEEYKKLFSESKKEIENKNQNSNDQISDDDVQKFIKSKQVKIKKDYFTRVTFYEDYSYENFVGCYKPIKKDDKITYEFEAGPFIDIYIKAKKDSKHNYLLAIEEINRANAAAVFGDLFQVLDRDNDGSSEYSVKPEAALNKYLEEHLPNYDGTISLPSNLYIWATMNSADQGVHVLDSAFKRRWQFLYMDIDNSESAAKIDDDIYLPVKDGIRKCKWNQFRKAINKVLKDNKIEEDRWVGAWFFKKDELKLIRTFYENKDNTKLKPNPLVDKLLAYLLQDVVKMNKDILFKTDYHNMSSIRKDLSNSNSPKNIFDILNIKIDENALEEVPKTENPTPTNAESAPNGQGEQTQVVTENG